jgi:hypothetical protein
MESLGADGIQPGMLGGGWPGGSGPVMSANETFLFSRMNQARTSGRFMVAIWHIEASKEPGKHDTLHFARVPFNFPRADFNECLRMLNEALVADTGEPKSE